jgi:hypothetical protein
MMKGGHAMDVWHWLEKEPPAGVSRINAKAGCAMLRINSRPNEEGCPDEEGCELFCGKIRFSRFSGRRIRRASRIRESPE